MSEGFTHPIGRRVLLRMNPGLNKALPEMPVVVMNATKHVVYEGLGYLFLSKKFADAHEAEQARPWKVSDAPQEFIDRLLQSIVGIGIPIAKLVGK
ncbi:putative FMN-binding domain protein [mine drainage metagenome]|uniref:Putative FMN-binding domain protein n=1 Tax=mine drainage metagenome TaxID=410659 RepID=A0A1J5T0M9_9ZZZZ